MTIAAHGEQSVESALVTATELAARETDRHIDACKAEEGPRAAVRAWLQRYRQQRVEAGVWSEPDVSYTYIRPGLGDIHVSWSTQRSWDHGGRELTLYFATDGVGYGRFWADEAVYPNYYGRKYTDIQFEAGSSVSDALVDKLWKWLDTGLWEE